MIIAPNFCCSNSWGGGGRGNNKTFFIPLWIRACLAENVRSTN